MLTRDIIIIRTVVYREGGKKSAGKKMTPFKSKNSVIITVSGIGVESESIMACVC